MSEGMIALLVSVWIAGSLGVATYAQGQGRSVAIYLLLSLLTSWIVVWAFLWLDRPETTPDSAYEMPTASGAVAVVQGRAIGVDLIFSFVIPIAGIVFAVLRFTKEEIGPGLACVLVSFVGSSFWAGLSFVLSR